MHTIDMKAIFDAMVAYENMGYKYVDVPYIVDYKYNDHTMPDTTVALNHIDGKVYSGSGEQGFLELLDKEGLPPGKYQTITPCVRIADKDDTHNSVFVKLELCIIPDGAVPNERLVSLVAFDAMNTMAARGITAFIGGTDEGLDIIEPLSGIELGSYGIRKDLADNEYIYGTGLAEPRFSYCKSLLN